MIVELSKRIIFQKCHTIEDFSGGFKEEWIDDFEVWAQITPTSFASKLFKLKNHLEVTHIIKVRYNKNITLQHRIKFSSGIFANRIFSIKSIINIAEDGKLLEISAVEEL